MLYPYSMDLLLEIERYLKGELSYKTGVELYEKLGNNAVLKALFKTEDAYSRNKLKAELQRICEIRKPDGLERLGFTDNVHFYIQKNQLKIELDKMTQAQFNAEYHCKPKPTSDYVSYAPSKKKGSINVEKLPGHLKTEYYKQISYIREISATNAKLLLMPTDEERHEAAKRIVHLGELRKAILKRIDHYLETGADPLDKPASAHSDPSQNEVSWLQAHYELKLLRSQRTKLKDKPARMADFKHVCERIEVLEAIVRKPV